MELKGLLLTSLTGLIVLLGGLIWKKYPPKKINLIYGYKTRRTMANQKVWDYANKVGAQMFIYVGSISALVSLICYTFFPTPLSILIGSVLVLVWLGIGIYWCETKLNERFDKNGDPKP